MNSIPGAPHVIIHPDRIASGRASAGHVVELLSNLITHEGQARVIFACAPSQNAFLDALVELSPNRVDWSKVHGFHMDEYIGITPDHPASFRHYLHAHLLSRVSLGSFQPIVAEAPDPEAECRRYAALIDAAPIDLICLGIGENGHLAFNDPPVADFDDPVSAKIVELDLTCREQQVHDGCFPSLEDVPRHAISLTMPVFRRARHLNVVVPGERKAAAIRGTILGEISTECPSSILRTHPNVTLFVDYDSASLLS